MLGTPDPIAFSIFGHDIRWYALLMCTAFIIGLILARYRTKKAGLNSDYIYDVFIAIIPLAIIGARLYYVAFNWDYYSLYPNQIIAIWNGGLAIHGGIIGGIIGLAIVCKIHKIKLLKMMDILTPSLILGQAIGRWGNYFNMEAYGRETTLPWAITVYEAGKGYIQVHPTFLYESIWDILVFFVLILIIDKRKKTDGVTTCWYFILYSIGRFFVEGLRTDSLYFMGLRTAQIVSILSVLGGVIALLIINKHAKKTDLFLGEDSPGSNDDKIEK